MAGQDRDGPEFAHGAGIAEDDAVEQSPFDFRQGNAPENLPTVRSKRQRSFFFLHPLRLHERNEAPGHKGKCDKDRGQRHAAF